MLSGIYSQQKVTPGHFKCLWIQSFTVTELHNSWLEKLHTSPNWKRLPNWCVSMAYSMCYTAQYALKCGFIVIFVLLSMDHDCLRPTGADWIPFLSHTEKQCGLSKHCRVLDPENKKLCSRQPTCSVKSMDMVFYSALLPAQYLYFCSLSTMMFVKKWPQQ